MAVKIWETDKDVLIRVIDSGVGMSQEQKEALLYGRKWKKAGGEASGIGLENTFSILRLVYPDSKLRISSRLNRGTCIEIRMSKGECIHEESISCR